jgi:hypothetical protein
MTPASQSIGELAGSFCFRPVVRIDSRPSWKPSGWAGAQAVPKMFDTLIGEKLQDTFPNELAISIVDSMSLEETH